MTIKAEASFAIFSTSNKRITTAIKAQVIEMVTTGVKYLGCNFFKNGGNKLSRLIANGKRDAASTPETIQSE